MLKKLKSIFIEEDPAPAAGSAKVSESTKKKTETKTKDKKEETPKGGKPSDKFIDLLLKAIEANNIEGFDYLEYKQSLQSLAKIEPDESKRFKSAFAMAQTMGLTKKVLFDSAQRYANVLGEEEKKFAEAFVKQKAAQVTNREKKISSLQQAIQQKEAEIKKLQKEIGIHQKELDNIESEMAKSMEKVQSTRDHFYGSYNLVLDQIKSDMDKINLYIE